MSALLETISPNMEHSAVTMVGWPPVKRTTHHTTSNSTLYIPRESTTISRKLPAGILYMKSPESTGKFLESSTTPQLKQRATIYFPGGDRNSVDSNVVYKVETKVFTYPPFQENTVADGPANRGGSLVGDFARLSFQRSSIPF